MSHPDGTAHGTRTTGLGLGGDAMAMVVAAVVFGMVTLAASIFGYHQALELEELRDENAMLRDELHNATLHHSIRDAMDDLDACFARHGQRYEVDQNEPEQA